MRFVPAGSNVVGIGLDSEKLPVYAPAGRSFTYWEAPHESYILGKDPELSSRSYLICAASVSEMFRARRTSGSGVY